MSSAEEVVILAKLAGTQQFLANAGEMGVAVEELGIKTDMAGAAMHRTTQRSYLMNQAMFTVRRLMYASTLVFIGAGVAALKFGWDFNQAMQSARVALAPVASGTFDVNRELDYLFNFTKHTPFQFKDVTIAFRQMYLGMRTLGISSDTVNATLHSMVDALSATGRTSPGALNRVAVALQHMAYMGHITGQVVLQLARDGLPIYAALSKQLHLTGDQIHNIGKLGIPAQAVLDALNKYIETTPGFANAAYRQSLTVHGLFTTIKDDISQLMGSVETGIFHRLQGRFLSITTWFDKFSTQIKTAKSVSAVVAILDPAALPLWKQFAADVHLAWQNFVQLMKAISGSATFWGTIYLALVLLHGVLLLIVPLTSQFRLVLDVLIPLFILWWTYTKLTAIWTGILAFETAIATKAVKDMTFAQFLATIVIGDYAIGARIASAATWAYVWSMTALDAAMVSARYAAAALWIVLELNPIVLILTAVILLVGGLVILYFRWKWFHDLVNSTFRWLVNQSPLVSAALVLAFGPLGAALETLILIVKYWDQLKRFWAWLGSGTGAPNQAGVPPGALMVPKGQKPKKVDAGFFAGMGIQGMASGGTVLSSGYSWVGEHGRELMHMPAGATVTPNTESNQLVGLLEKLTQGAGGGGTKIIRVQIGKRTIVDIVAEEVASAMARA